MTYQGKVIWLTGLSGAGKSTLGNLLQQELEKLSLVVSRLDGDEVRDFFENDLGYSRNERMMNVRRITFAAHCLAQKGINVIVCNIAPYYEVRDFVRRKLGDSYIQIYVKASVKAVSERDVKGMYKNFEEGKLTQLVGLDSDYEPPRRPDLIIETENESVQESLQKIMNLLKVRKLIHV